MGNLTILENLIDEKLMNMHTCFIGKVTATNGKTATVQPLNKVKQYGKTAQTQSVIPNVPILENARYKLNPLDISCITSINLSTSKSDGYVTSVSVTPTTKTLHTYSRESIGKGDIVVCVCGERDITETKKGKLATPSVGRHHNQSDAIIVGVLS